MCKYKYQLVSWSHGKNQKQIIEDLKLIDIVVEILDARIPLASQNPDVKEYTKGKKKDNGTK